jgi:polyisoprenoid-binding protein YceI
MNLAPSELQNLLNSANPPIVIDVLTPEAHAEVHLEGSENFCVYESAFLSKVIARFPEKNTPIVVYGAGAATREADAALEKLLSAGFTRVQVLAGGLEALKQAGLNVVTVPLVNPPPQSGNLAVDTAQSVIFWTGQNLFNHHTGTLRITSGSLEIKDGAFVSGRITLDMNSIGCTDIADSAMAAMLVHHLRDEDFFAVDRFPTAEFLFHKIEPLPASRPGIPNFGVSGSLTLRGVTKDIAFPASIARKHDGTFAAQAFLEIDRTDWGVLYGSSKFFARLSEHVVHDHIHLHLKISTMAWPRDASA